MCGFKSFKAMCPLAKVSMIMPTTATLDCTSLGCLGQHDRDRTFLFYVVPPKVAKASTIVAVAGVFTLKIANVHVLQHWPEQGIGGSITVLLTSCLTGLELAV
jgi:hypothetical protein